jgi:ABC-2 type transport system permease protein
MKGLILKDIYNLLKMLKQVMIVLVIFAVCFSGSADGTMVAMCVVMCSIFVSTTFTMDEKSDWSKYALVMPITRGRLVIAKYMSAGLFCIVGIALGVVFTEIIGLLPFGAGLTDMETLFMMGLTGILMALVFISVSIPVTIKYGADKGRYVLMGVVAIPMVLVAFLKDSIGWISEVLSGMPLVEMTVVAALVILAVSIFASLQIIKKKEF